ncbi:MAG: hypothetical protein AN484_17780 [Aphanizomenon flos-aquae WA102]|jgi:hypothetical protein|uniref:Uncharacterized protein n=1 Tax=Aphanizomenon flos-aquae WA102 TaxID=1710896 RepID=A0A1B7WZ98_APHFL|nr:MAG: hypothetical protein AN484_17780 [Aphanizomenon flos-aquae WA102]
MQFKIGQVYTTSQNQSFSIKIIRRTEKTIWFESMFDGEDLEFASNGKKRVEFRYGREVIIDGMYTFEAAPINRNF